MPSHISIRLRQRNKKRSKMQIQLADKYECCINWQRVDNGNRVQRAQGAPGHMKDRRTMRRGQQQEAASKPSYQEEVALSWLSKFSRLPEYTQ